MEDEYDHVVEEIYLTAVNSRGIYKRCFDILKLEMETGKDTNRLVYRSALWSAIREAKLENSGITVEQYAKAWACIRSDLVEPVLRELGLDISEAIKNGQRLLDEAQEKYEKQIQQTKEVNLMNELQNTPVKNITYVYGRDVNGLSKNDLMESIKRAKKEIATLKDVGVESKYIAGQIEDLEDAILLMTNKLDEEVK